jgi:hypothetical protein
MAVQELNLSQTVRELKSADAVMTSLYRRDLLLACSALLDPKAPRVPGYSEVVHSVDEDVMGD